MATTVQKNQPTELDTLRREVEELRAALAKRGGAAGAAIELPFKAHPPEYIERVLTVGRITVFLSPEQARKVTALAKGLREGHQLLPNGKPVYLPNHAIEWLLERLALVG